MPLALPPRRTFAASVVVLTCIATLSAVPESAAADEDGLVPGGPVAAAEKAPVPVTLVTGDRVLLSTSADGTPSGVVESDGDHYLRRFGGDLYVIPVEAEAALAADALDLELFNVTGLVEQGYDDQRSDSLPLIVEGDLPRARGPEQVHVEAELESIDATAVTVDKDDLDAAYDRLIGARSRSAGTAGKVWLDAKIEPSDLDLDPATGVEQTGAPRAWDRGFDGTGTRVAVLDTGYDAEHPDLADRVVAAQDFTGQGIDDSAGHGTHVASTIAGDGTADASRTGMAPGADLLIGKVLGWDGGQLSWIVGGMEWAVAQGADVVNMSLGSDQPTDCTDPMSQAAAALTEQTKTLFVVAAGNSAAHETVSSPGCVEGVLTVGAVDDRGETAWFSSRGAVLGSHDLKPDIAAPGVDIVGAQAGSPGGIHYVGMSGTSMATPHVVGAAALVRQAHPDWTAHQIKAALTASVKDSPEDTVYAQGAGELWTPDAIDATVTSDVSVEIADFDWPHGPDERASGTVTYTNGTDRDVRLRLGLEDVTGDDGGRVPGRLLELDDRFVTVRAHDTASVEVHARGDVGGLRDSAYGGIGGRIVATGLVEHDRVRVTTAVGMYLEPRTVEVTVRAIDRNGDPATSGNLDITDLHQPNRALYLFTGEDVTLRLRAGSHFLSSFIRTTEDDGSFSYSHLVDPDRRIMHDMTLVLDARDARPVSVRGDRPMMIRSGSFGVQRTWDGWVVGDSMFAQRDPEFFATPTAPARHRPGQ
jgi:subtilisin family serine protease